MLIDGIFIFEFMIEIFLFLYVLVKLNMFCIVLNCFILFKYVFVMNLVFNGFFGNRIVFVILMLFIGLMCGVDFIKYFF